MSRALVQGSMNDHHLLLRGKAVQVLQISVARMALCRLVGASPDLAERHLSCMIRHVSMLNA